MGRGNSALAQHDPLEALAQWLDELRRGYRESGMSWCQLARKVSQRGLTLSESTLYRAVQRKRVPKWRTVQAFTEACGGAEQKAKELWTAADRYAAARTNRVLSAGAMPPQLITEPWQLIQAMNHRRRVNGNPTLRELQARALVDEGSTASHLPKSTLSAVLRGRMPPRALLEYFVRHCGSGTQDEVAEWEAAWERAQAHLRGERLPEESVRQELARIQAELADTRERLGETTADLVRAVRTAHVEPVPVVDPLPGRACPSAICSPLGQFGVYLGPAAEDGGGGAALLTTRRGEPGGSGRPGLTPAIRGCGAGEGTAVKPEVPTRAVLAGPAAVVLFGECPVAVPAGCPGRTLVRSRQDVRR